MKPNLVSLKEIFSGKLQPKKLKQVVLRDNKTGQFISAKRFKKLSKKRTSREKIYV